MDRFHQGVDTIELGGCGWGWGISLRRLLRDRSNKSWFDARCPLWLLSMNKCVPQLICYWAGALKVLLFLFFKESVAFPKKKVPSLLQAVHTLDTWLHLRQSGPWAQLSFESVNLLHRSAPTRPMDQKARMWDSSRVASLEKLLGRASPRLLTTYPWA